MNRSSLHPHVLVIVTAGCTALAAAAASAPPTSRPAGVGPSPTLGAPPPAFDDRTVVLFDGTSWSGWVQRDGTPSPWAVQDDGSVMVVKGDAITDRVAGDFQLHLEFLCPEMPEARGQARANSGVYLHGRYEVQVLDSYGLAPAEGDCGAIYSIARPLVNACRPPGEWQTYDIVFRAPRFEGDVVTTPARVTVQHNGITIHSNVDLPHATAGCLAKDIVAQGPLLLQDHGNPVRYRNIWIRRLGS